MTLKRRDFLRALGIGGAAGALIPTLESTALAAPNGARPTRLVIFFSANGSLRERWRPSGSENDWQIPQDSILSPLRPYKDDLLVVEGVDMRSARHGPGDGHQTGMGHMLTGTELLPGDNSGGCNSCDGASWAGGPSIDQHIARAIHDGEAFRSLEFGIKCGAPNIWSRMCYAAADRPIAPQEDPHAAFDRLFHSVGASAERLARQKRRRASVLDFLAKDLSRATRQVSATDKARIDEHLTSIRELEGRLKTGDGQGFACELPDQGQPFDANKEANFPQTGRAMMDLIVAALACGSTRVASLQWSRSVSQVAHPWANVSDRHHDLSHEGNDNDTAMGKIVKINRWYAEQFGYLVGKLKAIPEGNGTLLDNTAVIWVNELGRGNSHTRNDVPYVIAGSAGGYFKTGRYLVRDDEPHNNMLVSLARAMGVNINTFGNPAYCTGELSGLRG